MKVPSTGSKDKPINVAILGGGLSGLTCGYKLAAGNIPDVQLFEAQPHLGGRALTHTYEDGSTCELGGERIRRSHRDIQQVAQDLNVSLLQEPDFNFIAMSEEGMENYDDKLLELAASLEENLSDLEPQDIGGTLRSVGEDEAADLVDNVCAEYSTHISSTSDLAKILRGFTAQSSKQDKEFNPDSMQYKVQGGNKVLVTALTEQIGAENIHTQHILKKLSKEEDLYVMEFDTEYGSQKIYSKSAVISIPFSVLRNVDLDDSLQLPSSLVDQINTLPYEHKSKVCFHFDSKPEKTTDEQLLFGLCSVNDQESYLWDGSIGQQQKTVVLYVEHGTEPVNMQFDKEFQRTAKQMLEDNLGAKTKQVVVKSWAKEKFNAGAWAEHGVEIPENTGNLAFAGEHTQKDNGFLNSAVSSGLAAAKHIAAIQQEQSSAAKPTKL